MTSNVYIGDIRIKTRNKMGDNVYLIVYGDSLESGITTCSREYFKKKKLPQEQIHIKVICDDEKQAKLAQPELLYQLQKHKDVHTALSNLEDGFGRK